LFSSSDSSRSKVRLARHERTLTTASLIGKPQLVQNDQADIKALAKKSNSDYFAGMNRL
jgi:hypothetical protein